MQVRDKSVLVTGASSGIGRAIAREFWLSGASVMLAARREDKLREAVEGWGRERPDAASRLAFCRLDVREEESCRQAVEAVRQKWGRLEILVNNAGYSTFGLIKDYPLKEAQGIFDTNFFGAARMSLAAFPLLTQSKDSYVVMISSVAAKRGLPWLNYYCATKAAMNSLAESMRMEWDAYGTRVLTVMPGPTESDIVASAKTFGGAYMPSVYPGQTAHELARRLRRALEKNKKELYPALENRISVWARTSFLSPAIEYFLSRLAAPWDLLRKENDGSC